MYTWSRRHNILFMTISYKRMLSSFTISPGCRAWINKRAHDIPCTQAVTELRTQELTRKPHKFFQALSRFSINQCHGLVLVGDNREEVALPVVFSILTKTSGRIYISWITVLPVSYFVVCKRQASSFRHGNSLSIKMTD